MFSFCFTEAADFVIRPNFDKILVKSLLVTLSNDLHVGPGFDSTSPERSSKNLRLAVDGTECVARNAHVSL